MGYFLSMTKLQWRLVYWYTNSKSVMRSIWLYQLCSMLWQIEVVLFLDVQKTHSSIILKVCQSVSHFLSVPSIQKLLFSQMVQKCRSPGKKCPTWPNRRPFVLSVAKFFGKILILSSLPTPRRVRRNRNDDVGLTCTCTKRFCNSECTPTVKILGNQPPTEEIWWPQYMGPTLTKNKIAILPRFPLPNRLESQSNFVAGVNKNRQTAQLIPSTTATRPPDFVSQVEKNILLRRILPISCVLKQACKWR